MDPDRLWQSEMLEPIEENLPKKRPTITSADLAEAKASAQAETHIPQPSNFVR